MARNYETIIFIASYYIIINIILFIIIFIDKKRAIKNKWRIQENTLFTFFLLGGFCGGFLAMQFIRHKNKKPKFYLIFLLSILTHIFIWWFLLKK